MEVFENNIKAIMDSLLCAMRAPRVVYNINFDCLRKGGHRAGESLTGTLVYRVSRPVVFKELTLTFIGIAKCGSKQKRLRRSEQIILLKLTMLEGDILTRPGVYLQEFEFEIPDNIPSSFKSKKPFIKISYHIVSEAKTMCALVLTSTKRSKQEVIIYGNLKLNMDKYDHYIQSDLVHRLISDEIFYLEAKLSKHYVEPGNTINIDYNINNKTGKPLVIKEELKCTIVMQMRGENAKEQKVEKTMTITLNVYKLGKQEHKFDSAIMTKKHHATVEGVEAVSVKYAIMIQCLLSEPHVPMTLVVPVAIGRYATGEFVVMPEMRRIRDKFYDHESNTDGRGLMVYATKDTGYAFAAKNMKTVLPVLWK